MRLGNIGNSKRYDFLTWHSPAILSHYIVSFCPFPFYCRSRYLWIPQRAKICLEAFVRQRQLFRPLLSWICCKQVSRWFWYFLILFWLLTAMQCHSQTVRCTPWSCSGDHEWRHVWHQLVKLLQYWIVLHSSHTTPGKAALLIFFQQFRQQHSRCTQQIVCSVVHQVSQMYSHFSKTRIPRHLFVCGEYPHLSPVLQ